jgi:hypothetical protein
MKRTDEGAKKIERVDLRKHRKEGNITPEVLHDTLGRWIEDGQLEAMITVFLAKDGDVSVGHTNMKLSEVIGLLELAKIKVLVEQGIL